MVKSQIKRIPKNKNLENLADVGPLDQFGSIQNLQLSPIPQTSFLVCTFFAGSYSKSKLGK